MKPDRFYIIDITNICKITYFSKGFFLRGHAQDAIDRNLSIGKFIILTGRTLTLLNLPKRRANFKLYPPALYRTKHGIIRFHTKRKRRRLQKHNIKVKEFKTLWRPLKLSE